MIEDGLHDGLLDSIREFGAPLTYTILLNEGPVPFWRDEQMLVEEGLI